LNLPILTDKKSGYSYNTRDWFEGVDILFPLEMTAPTQNGRNQFWSDFTSLTQREFRLLLSDTIQFAPFDDLKYHMPRMSGTFPQRAVTIGESYPPEDELRRHGPLTTGLIKKIAGGGTLKGSVIAFVNSSGYITGAYFVERNLLIFYYYQKIQGSKSEIAEDLAKVNDRLKMLVEFVETFTPAKKDEKFSADNLRIGTDIEFSVFDPSGSFFDATCFVDDSLDGAIGTDGNVATLEIRPKAARSPEALTKNVEDILFELSKKMPPGHDLLGGGSRSLRRSTGLHIHFSNTRADSNQHGLQPDQYVVWLDNLLGNVLVNLPGGARSSDGGYGQPGDWRSKVNHGEFGHNGWEWRRPPTTCIDRDMTLGVFAIAWCIVKTATVATKPYAFDETNFSIKWYEGLEDFDKYADSIQYVVNFIQGKQRLDVPILRTWFNRPFEKDFECDIEVHFANESGLEISPFKIYHPQKLFKTVLVYTGDRDRMVCLSTTNPEGIPNSVKEFIENRAEVAVRISKVLGYNESALKRPVLYFGISRQLLNELLRASRGSRNRVKMFVQDLIKNM
jgi:hypothetical protein